MHITILTLFPEMFKGPFDASIIKRAQKKHIVDITYVNIRDFATDKYKTVDGHPYGGGPGMILRVDVVDKALRSARETQETKTKVILLDPQGKTFNQKKAKELSAVDHLILICGHYEGVDERIRSFVDEEISIGDYVMTCGEIPAMVLVDSIVRLLPRTLKKPTATTEESFSGTNRILEYPQFTKPLVYKRKRVPAILLSGHHEKITAWRKQEAWKKTQLLRPDLLTEKTDQM